MKEIIIVFILAAHDAPQPGSHLNIIAYPTSEVEIR